MLLVTLGLRLRLGSSRETMDDAWQPVRLPSNLGFLLLDEFATRLIAVEAAQGLHRHTPVRGSTAILEYDIEQDGAALLR